MVQVIDEYVGNSNLSSENKYKVKSGILSQMKMNEGEANYECWRTDSFSNPTTEEFQSIQVASLLEITDNQLKRMKQVEINKWETRKIIFGIITFFVLWFLVEYLNMRMNVCAATYDFFGDSRYNAYKNDDILSVNKAAFGYWHPWMVETFFSAPPNNMAVFAFIQLLMQSDKLTFSVKGDSNSTTQLLDSGYPMRFLLGDASQFCTNKDDLTTVYSTYPFNENDTVCNTKCLMDDENTNCCETCWNNTLLSHYIPFPGKKQDFPDFIQDCVGDTGVWEAFIEGGIYMVCANLSTDKGALDMWSYVFKEAYKDDADSCKVGAAQATTTISSTTSMGVTGAFFGPEGAVAGVVIGSGMGMLQNYSDAQSKGCPVTAGSVTGCTVS